MSNPPKAKGTRGETEFVRALQAHGFEAERVKAGEYYDVRVKGHLPSIKALATRPDKGSWLVTMRLSEFVHYLRLLEGKAAEIEVKRWGKFAHHTVFEKKFGGRA
jgi:Holliday junction resolvase